MNRKFNTYSKITIKNKDDKDFHIPEYQNRTSSSETIAENETKEFGIWGFGSSAYYYRNIEGKNVESEHLYDDGDVPSPTPISIRINNNTNSDVQMSFNDGVTTFTVGANGFVINDSDILPDSYNSFLIYAEETVKVSGTYRGSAYSNQLLNLNLIAENTYQIQDPIGDATWYFSSDDSITIDIDSASQDDVEVEDGSLIINNINEVEQVGSTLYLG